MTDAEHDSPRIHSIRLARPARSMERTVHFYVDALGFELLGGFLDHDGFDGSFVGPKDENWHLEVTFTPEGPLPQPTDEDLLVLYVSEHERDRLSDRLSSRGHQSFEHPNPYWRTVGALCFRDPDGYVLVLCPIATPTD